MIDRLIKYILIFTLASAVASCTDEILLDNQGIVEGDATVSSTIIFKDLAKSSLGGSRSAGNAVKQISNLCVLVYSADGSELKHHYYADAENGSHNFDSFSIDKEGNSGRPDGDNGTSAEGTTPSARLTFKIPNGKYQMFAVANMGDITRDPDLGEQCKTVDGLKSIRLNWIDKGEGDLYAIDSNTNNQMLGYFTKDNTADRNFTAPAVAVVGNTQLHCWLRRAASKVTVAFDGSRLVNGVRIYLKSVEIKDIPISCPLGKKNTPDADDQVKQGEIIYYPNASADATNYEEWPVINLGHPKYPAENPHGETVPALFFYENMQGNETDNPDIKDKRQDHDKDGSLDAPGLPGDPGYIAKDDVKYGSYIEVHAHYDARYSDRPSNGDIIYRFMLGKDVIKDYDADRNHHFKLTLCFNGYANDVDWHIEYEEEVDLIAPDPYYISYLYDQEAVLPIRLKGTDFSNVYLKAEIIENNWHPDTDDNVYWKGTVHNDGPWHGFLSLTDTKEKIIGDGLHHTNDALWNKNEYNKVLATIDGDPQSRGVRIYRNLSKGEYPNDEVGGYTVDQNDKGIVVNVPFYSRAKQMVPTSGYTGNNPYEAYRRSAKVKLTLYDNTTNKPVTGDDGSEKSQTVTIYQVRRCVNPKGVWRSWNNSESFHVQMKILESEYATSFTGYESDGPWRAKVETDPTGLISLRPSNGENFKNGWLQGKDFTMMDFHIDFNGTCTSKEEVRCAIVLVEYNNYTCKHRILVRQGYAPIALNDANIKWHTCNMYSATEETLSPLEEGSMFRFGNWNDAILASNNKTYGFQAPVGDNTLALAGGNDKKWSDITSQESTDINTPVSFADTKVKNVIGYDNNTETNVRVATIEDYENLRDATNREFAYGVLYGDGATETMESIEDVYEYYRIENGGRGYPESNRGMRGCFVFNTENGNNLFFPIGATGHGQRRTEHAWYGETQLGAGRLQYAWRNEEYKKKDELGYRPLFLDVYRRPGAIYWVRTIPTNPTNKNKKYCFLDINYFTFDFSPGETEPTLGTGTSACFIRCVEEIP